MEKRNVAIMFSGGFDSTYLLLNMLEKIPDLEVTLINVTSNVLPGNKNKREENAIKHVMSFCNKKYPNSTLKLINLYMELDSYHMIYNGLAQPMLWIPSALLYVRSNTDIYFGYNIDDEINKNDLIENINTVIKSLSELLGKEDIECKLPLIDKSKHTILCYLMSNCPDLFYHLTCCENDSEPRNSDNMYIKDCMCFPCTKLYTTLLDILEHEIQIRSEMTPLAKSIIKYLCERFPSNFKCKIKTYKKILNLNLSLMKEE